MLIGVVGKSGSGKSSLVRRMKCFDDSIIHVDIDKIGHDILKDKEVVRNNIFSNFSITSQIIIRIQFNKPTLN